MGRSESRLSSTRSAVVRSSLRLRFGTPRLPLAAPVPPYTFLRRQSWIARLRDGCSEDVEAADVRTLPGDLAQASIHLARVGVSQLSDAADAQQLEVAQHGRPYRDQILQVLSFPLR